MLRSHTKYILDEAETVFGDQSVRSVGKLLVMLLGEALSLSDDPEIHLTFIGSGFAIKGEEPWASAESAQKFS
jgi:hypothetical protein